MPGVSVFSHQKFFDLNLELLEGYRQDFDEGKYDLAIFSCFAFSAVNCAVSGVRRSQNLQSRNTDVVFDHLFFVANIPSQIQLNDELRHATYKASLYCLIQALFAYSNETARHPGLLKKIEILLDAYCAEANMPRHPFFDQFNDDWQRGALTTEQRTSYLALLSFACYLSQPVVRFDKEGVFGKPKDKRLIHMSLSSLNFSRDKEFTKRIQKLGPDARDAFIDCFAFHLSDAALSLHFLGQRLYNEGRGILNAEQKFKILSNLIPAIEAIKQQHPDLKASKYPTLEGEYSDSRSLVATDEKCLLRLFRDLETYKAEFKALERCFPKAPSDSPRPDESGIEMTSLASLFRLFSSDESSDDGSEADAELLPEGLRQRRQSSIQG